MDGGFFLRGLTLGLSIAAPVGPIGILCIRRTLTQGLRAGLISGLGAATADGIYGCIAGFCLSFVSRFLIDYQFGLRLVGGGFLCYLGLQIFRAHPAENAAETQDNNLIGAYVSTFFLTLTNPMTIFSFAVIFMGLGLGSSKDSYLSAGILVLGVFIGSCLWWLLLSVCLSLFRAHFTSVRLRWLNRISAGLIIGFGIWALLEYFRLVK